MKDEIIRLAAFAYARPERIFGAALRGETPGISYFVEKVENYVKISRMSWKYPSWSEPEIIYEGDIIDAIG